MTVIIPAMTAELEPVPAPLPAIDDGPVQRLAAAWLLGYQSPAAGRSYAADLAAWLAFCSTASTDVLAGGYRDSRSTNTSSTPNSAGREDRQNRSTSGR